MVAESLLHQNPQHEPDINTRNLWLFCRRKRTQLGSPGFFCAPARWDTALFFLILLLEFIGLYLFYRYVGNLVFAVAFFAADLTYAVSAHLVYGRITLTRNRMFLLHQRVKIYITRKGERMLTPVPAVQARRERRKLIGLRIYAGFFYALILLLALFKMGGFIANWPGQDTINSITVTICLTYVVVAALQIYATGFFTFSALFGLLFGMGLKKHRSKQGRLYARIDAGTASGSLHEGIDLHAMLLHDPKFEELGYRNRGRDGLPKFNDCSVRNHFIHGNRLFLYGILTDEDLDAFVNSHANLVESRQVLGLILLDLQIEKGLLQGGIDRYTEPVPFPAGNIAGPGAIDRSVTPVGTYSVARVGNDLFENRRERPGLAWHYEWLLHEAEVVAGGGQKPGQPITGVLAPVADPPGVRIDFSSLRPGATFLLTVFVRNLAEPSVRGIASPPFEIRILS